MMKKAIPGLTSIAFAVVMGLLAIGAIQHDPATWRIALVIIGVCMLSAMGGAFTVAAVTRHKNSEHSAQELMN